MADQRKKLDSALAKIRTARRDLEKEQRRLERVGGTKKDKRQVSTLIDKLDEVEFSLLSAREQLKLVTRRERQRKFRPLSEIDETEIYAPKAGEYVARERELSIRGFWDRYPSADQRGKYKAKFKHIPKEIRRGPSAFDLLLRDYLSFDPSERKRLVLRVSYGVIHETGEIITPDEVRKMRLDVRLSSNRQEAINALSTLLVRAGLIYTPEGYENDTEESGVPLGVEWVVLPKARKSVR